MLLIDGVRYEVWAPTSEDELEDMVQEHAKDIFGADSLYFDLKHKLKGGSLGTIPDGFAITFGPDQLWIVEVELASHDLYGHIQKQIGKFIAVLPDPKTSKDLLDVILADIKADPLVYSRVKKAKGDDVHEWLSDLVNQGPRLAVIIEKRAPDLDVALRPFSTMQPKVVEFATYTRKNVGFAVHGHEFEPLVAPADTAAPVREWWDALIRKQALGIIAFPTYTKTWHELDDEERHLVMRKFAEKDDDAIVLSLASIMEDVGTSDGEVSSEGKLATKKATPGGLPPKGWTPAEVRQFWSRIKPGAKRVLKEISKRPNGYPREDVLKVLSVDGRKLAGLLSSVGHNMKFFKGKARPVELDWDTMVYRMQPEVASEIAKL